MFTMEEVLSKENQEIAFAHLEKKKDSCGSDGMKLSELHSYWELNKERIIGEIEKKEYTPGYVRQYEILNKKGKKRTVYNFTAMDRFLSRLLSQKLRQYIEPEFLKNSFAYQEGKGIENAIARAKEYILSGDAYVVEIDLKNYFDSISLEKLAILLETRIVDKRIMFLIQNYLYCNIIQDGHVTKRTKGIIQGNSMSPLLSNLYLHGFDMYLERKGYHWVRFADDLNIYVTTKDEAEVIFQDVCLVLKEEYQLTVNEKKSRISSVFQSHFLGYDFCKKKGNLEVRKHKYEDIHHFSNWHPSVLQHINKEYHILQNGILNKKDYALLFENEEHKHHIPVEAVSQLNLYGEVTLSSNVLNTISKQNIRLGVFDKYGNLIGYYVPRRYQKDAEILLKQCELYLDEEKRLSLARKMQIAGIHNLRANLKYYNKKMENQLESFVKTMTVAIADLTKAVTINEMLMIEARTRQKYYEAFNFILPKECGFCFVKRTRRPPKDELNAMLSFGNTLLYNQFQQIIWKTSLESRIGIVHATGRRETSLNLDFSDVFKPIIVDRTIFTLVKKHQIKKENFTVSEKGGVYLDKEGKKLFIEAFERKLESRLIVKGKECSYKQLMEKEIYNYQRSIRDGSDYKPYKYY